MKAKDLFRKIEAVNFIYGATNAGGQVYITCDVIDADKQTNVIHVYEYKPYNDRFHSWKRFEITVDDELSLDISDLIRTGELKYSKVSKSFYIENADWIIRFYVWEE